MNNSCLGCGAELPGPFLDLGTTPLANGYVSGNGPAAPPEPRFPLAVAFCGNCYLVQLLHTVPPDALFGTYLYYSSYSSSYVEHARRMCDALLRRFHLPRNGKVLEIASNDGYLLQHFRAAGVQVLGIEPASNIAADAVCRGIPTLNCFFGSGTATEIAAIFGRADLVIGNNVLAHVPAINDFLQGVATCLHPEGTAVFEFPYIGDLLRKAEFDTIYHEHVFYFSLSAVQRLASRARLTIVDVEHQPVHGGSLRVYLGHESRDRVAPAVCAFLDKEEDEGLRSVRRYNTLTEAVGTFRTTFVGLLRELSMCGKRIAAYGAPAKGNTLLNYCGIGTDLIDFTVDRNPHKQGMLLPGSRIPVLSPEELTRRMPDYAVVLPWNIAEEIVAQESEYLARGGRLIMPFPEIRMIGSEGPVLAMGRQAGQSR